MSVTRTSLIKCHTKGCPFTPDEHEEWMALCRKAPEHGHRGDQLSHQHLPKKGMGGKNEKSKIVAILCWPMHDRIDNGDWSNHVRDLGQGEIYFAQDLHGKTLIERPVGSAGADTGMGGASVAPALVPKTDSASAPPAGEKEEGDESRRLSNNDTAGHLGSATRYQPNHSPRPLTHEQRVAIARRIRRSKHNHPWATGDTANEWIAELGEEAWQYIETCSYECLEPRETCPGATHRHDAMGYTIPSFGNVLSTCERVPEEQRHHGLSYSHHVVVAKMNREDMEMWLDKCEEEGWSVSTFRRQVHGVKPKTKRWTLDELYDAASRWGGDAPEFVNWLEGQDGN